MRTILVAVLLGIGVLLTFSANATVWANRVVFNTDAFSRTVNRVMDDPAVQQQLAVRVSDSIVVQGDLEARFREELPQNLQFLARPLTVSAQQLIERITLRILQSPDARDVLDTAIRGVHSQVVSILEDKSNALVIKEGQVVLDLGAILQRVVQELGVGQSGGLVQRLDLPPDAGQIVLIDDASTAQTVSNLVQLHNRLVWVLVAAAVGVFALGVLIAKDRRKAIRNVGLLIIMTGLIAAIVLFPIRGIASGFAQNPDVARKVFNHLVFGYRIQSLVLVLIGALIALGGMLAGDTELARAVRGTVRRREGEPAPDLAGAIRGAAPLLRVVGLVAGALALVAWPDPSTRIYVTILGFIAAYFIGIWIVTSDTAWAASVRGSCGDMWRRIGRRSSTDSPGARGWLRRQAGAFRIAGIVVAMGFVVFWPGLSFASFVAIGAITLLYLALIDWLTTERE